MWCLIPIHDCVNPSGWGRISVPWLSKSTWLCLRRPYKWLHCLEDFPFADELDFSRELSPGSSIYWLHFFFSQLHLGWIKTMYSVSIYFVQFVWHRHVHRHVKHLFIALKIALRFGYYKLHLLFLGGERFSILIEYDIFFCFFGKFLLYNDYDIWWVAQMLPYHVHHHHIKKATKASFNILVVILR